MGFRRTDLPKIKGDELAAKQTCTVYMGKHTDGHINIKHGANSETSSCFSVKFLFQRKLVCIEIVQYGN